MSTPEDSVCARMTSRKTNDRLGFRSERKEMEEPLCFVRDNPFFKADGGCKRLVRRAPMVLRPQQNPVPAAEKELEMAVVETVLETGTPTSPSDLEYGPGIVEKLKAKFSKLSGLTSREPAKRRSPSLDELNSHHDYEPVRTTEQMLRRHSKSSSDVLTEDARSYTIHRHIRMEHEEKYIEETPSINTLRRRFETSERSRSLSRSRPVSADFTSHYHNLSTYEPPIRTVRLEPEVETLSGVVSPPTIMSPGIMSPRQETGHREMMLETPLPVAPVEVYHYQPPGPIREPPPPQRENGEGVRKLRVLEVLNHADNEPEFVKIARSLRKSAAPPADLFETQPEESHILKRSEIVQAVLEPNKTEHHQEPNLRQYEAPVNVPAARIDDYKAPEQPKTPVPRKFVIRGEAHLPTLSNNFKIIREIPSNYTDLPPDPQPMRRNSVEKRVVSPIQTHVSLAPVQGSPPPEEPRPSKVPEVSRNNEPCRMCEEKGKETEKEEGFSEIQRLLSRFQLSRNTRGSYEVNPAEEEKALSSNYSPPQPPLNPPPYDSRPFSATVVGVHNSARQATAYGRVNVVSISVRSDAPSVISNNNNSPDVSPISTAVAANKRPAPSPPDVSSFPQPQPVAQPVSQSVSLEERRSLSSQYFDEKARREKPYGDDVTELRTELRESSVDDTDDEQQMVPTVIEAQPPVQDSEESAAEESENDDLYYPPRPFSLNFPEPMIAGDGNPVRHTLLSLVMEEDIPQLLEAMNERYHFVFEDLHHSEPSTSSIIHPMETRKQRRIHRQVNSIKFQEENPVVYAYLDEDAQTSEQWKDGAFLSYDQYQKIWEEAAEDAAMGIAELERWKAEVTRRLAEQEEQLAEQQISSSAHFADSNTICSRTPAVA